MSTEHKSEPRQPPPASTKDNISLIKELTSGAEARGCFVLPLAAFVFTFLIGRIVAPDFAPGTESEYSSFFSTVAQVIVAILIALALELRALPFRKLNTQRLIVGFTLVYVALGVAAAVVALGPGLSSTLYQWLFALAIAAGAAALVSVLTISFTALENEFSERRAKAQQR